MSPVCTGTRDLVSLHHMPNNEIPRWNDALREGPVLGSFLEPDRIGPRLAPGVVTDEDARVGAGPGAQIELGFGDPLLPGGFVFRGSANEEDAVHRRAPQA